MDKLTTRHLATSQHLRWRAVPTWPAPTGAVPPAPGGLYQPKPLGLPAHHQRPVSTTGWLVPTNVKTSFSCLQNKVWRHNVNEMRGEWWMARWYILNIYSKWKYIMSFMWGELICFHSCFFFIWMELMPFWRQEHGVDIIIKPTSLIYLLSNSCPLYQSLTVILHWTAEK
jgi:hypothetical protein